MGARRITEAQIDHAIALRNQSRSFSQIAAIVGASEEAIRMKVVERIGGGRIYTIQDRARDYPREEARQLYLGDGVSLKAIANRYGIERQTLTNDFKRAGIPLRGRSAAMFTRMSKTTREERKRLADAANNAVRGKSQSHEWRVARAESRRRRVGIGEKALRSLLSERGYSIDPQRPVDVYNVDIAVDHVAVELHTGGVGQLAEPKYVRRLEHLFDRGYSVLFVFVSSERAIAENIEHVVADLERMRGLPPGSREHRVVRCHFNVEPFRRGDRNEFLPGKRTTERPKYSTVYPVDRSVSG